MHSNRLARGVAYTMKKPVQIGDTIFTYVKKDKSWKNSASNTLSEDERFKKWMMQYNLAIMPDPCVKTIKKNRRIHVRKESKTNTSP